MATLNGAGNDSALNLELYETPYSNGFSRVELHAGTDRLGAWFRTTDLLAALNAVTKGELKAAEETERANHESARKFCARAEAAEAKLARVEEALIGWQMLRNEWKERAYAAESKLNSVRDIEKRLADLVERNEHTMQELDALVAIRAALADAPAFVLPTTAGAGITALYEGGRRLELRLFADGEWAAKQTGRSYTPAGVMSHFTGHRLIGESE